MTTSTSVTGDIEIVRPGHARGGFRFALFDFDGTLSLIREGWQQVMIPMMVEILQETSSGESREEIEACVHTFVDLLTGKQTIFQMIRLKEEVEKRGCAALEPVEYKQRYHDLLWQRIEHRVAGLKDGSLSRKQFMVPGSEDLLQALRARGVSLFLASGTDSQYVHDECAALGLTDYFDGGVYGAQDDYRLFSKKMIIDRIYKEHGLHGPELLAFGDGYVEIENTKEVGGVAVGVASDEVGLVAVDAWKRRRLIDAGADVIIPHYRNHEALIAYLLEGN
jgi:phosphoglycolate phosphatase-like HAD superfamily hydrolase